jgi:hypothetical protein
MAAFIVNPRRSPRAAARCEARVALRDGGFWATPTSDYGPRGCQLVAPCAFEPGSRIFLQLVNERVASPVRLSGRVAWSSRAEPWRAGIAFDPSSFVSAAGFFEQLAAAHPGLDAYGRAPDRIPEDAPLAPAPPPAVEPALTVDERAVLATLGPGLVATTLREKLGERWPHAVHAMFALLGRRYLVVGAEDTHAADLWAPLVSRAA